MLIGHLPAGYLASTAALDRLGVDARLRRRLLTAGLVASVAPDLDLLFFYGIDSSVHHHALFPHWPTTWLAVLGAGLIVARVRKSRAWALGAVFAGGGGLLHILLDTIAGEVRWLAPASEWSLTLATVPPQFDSWIASFAVHWTFGIEIALVLAALAVWWMRHRGGRMRWLRLGAGLAVFLGFWVWATLDEAHRTPDEQALEAIVGAPLGEARFHSSSPLRRGIDVVQLHRLPIPNQMSVRLLGDAWTYTFESDGPFAPPRGGPLDCTEVGGVTACWGEWGDYAVRLRHETASGEGTVTAELRPPTPA